MHKLVVLLLSIVTIFYSCKEEGQAEVVNKYPDGTTQKVHFVTYEKNKKIVLKEIRFFPNGEKELEGEFKNGQKHGKWTYWYNNRQKWIEENYQNGNKHGTIVEFYKSGEINYKGNFKNNLPDGDWDFYDGNGNITSSATYKNGQKIN